MSQSCPLHYDLGLLLWALLILLNLSTQEISLTSVEGFSTMRLSGHILLVFPGLDAPAHLNNQILLAINRRLGACAVFSSRPNALAPASALSIIEGDTDVSDPSGSRQNRSVNLGFGSSFQP
jgi:hypothetical protein